MDISFQGRTLLHGSPEFYKLTIPQHRRVLNASTRAHLTNSRQYFIDANNNSLVVLLRGDNDGRVIFVPTGNGLAKAKDRIIDGIKELKNTASENLTAWIISNSRINNGGETGARASLALNEIAETIEEFPKVDLSVLAGNKGEPLRLFIKTKGSQKPENKISNFKIAMNMVFNPRKSLRSQFRDRFEIVEIKNTYLSKMPV